MREELANIEAAIARKQLPPDLDELFGPIWDSESKRFITQETFILDFKEDLPEDFRSDYGAGILRLTLGFYNSYGGIIVFGVRDRTLEVTGTKKAFDIEKFNRLLSDLAEIHIECLARDYAIGPAQTLKLTVVLVPKRTLARPAKLLRSFGPYGAGKLWVRDRHEVLEASRRHLPFLYSERFGPDPSEQAPFPVHISLPPSPATVKDFVNRGNIIELLWDWFVFGDQPRLYLHGPGGSGKSTLAYEFARMLADNGSSVRLKNGDRLDYVIYLSGKETEFNSKIGRQQKFELRDFDNSKEQFAQILYHSGFLNEEEAASVDDTKFDQMFSELFGTFAGLIVIDDIDALSRRKMDTGEESLFVRAVQAQKRTRILYTLRNTPAYAVNSAVPVLGLNPDELLEFIEVCSKQFSVTAPSPETWPKIEGATNSLPLLVETIIALRKFTGNYQEALQTFIERGGSEARRYLYQREYDRLEPQGRSKIVLAALQLLSQPVGFSALLGILQISRDQIVDALNESSSIFLSTQETDEGETLYELVPPCAPFVASVSTGLPHYSALERRVQHFRTLGRSNTPEESALIIQLERLAKSKKFSDMVRVMENIKAGDPVLENPRIRALLGQAYYGLGPDFREKARECFKHAEGVSYRDAYMMRSWYFLEVYSGYGRGEAERICRNVIGDQRFSSKYKSEFWTKLGNCLFYEATSLLNTNRDKALSLLRESIAAHLEALHLTKEGREAIDALTGIERPLQRFVAAVGGDVEHFFAFFEGLLEQRHDVPIEGIIVVLGYFSRSKAPVDRTSRDRVRGLCTRTIAKISRHRALASEPGFQKILVTLGDLSEHLANLNA